MLKLNLGAGPGDRNVEGYLSVDIAPPADVLADLSERWPWDDSSVEHVLAYDVCEHIGTAVESSYVGDTAEHADFVLRNVDGRIWFANELWRVLAPGARAIVETPNASRGCGYWQDPTHCSPWCLSTFKYFEHGAFARERLGDAYGIKARFKVIGLAEFETNGEDPREKAWKIRAELEAVKP